MRRIRSGCCARAASGHAAAAPPSKRDELAPSHCLPRGSGHGIVAIQTGTLEGGPAAHVRFGS